MELWFFRGGSLTKTRAAIWFCSSEQLCTLFVQSMPTYISEKIAHDKKHNGTRNRLIS